ncbi:MAG TPA: molybdopterin-guanine dinucleotide biosynthesis protein B [Thermoanaerobaculia bacterium]|nr:molybdopterin-guanine dinucleotide biosynthesis protein B [Thermoanaerobaculia bacterium]
MTAARFGIDVLLEKPWPVAGKRVGLITNPSGVTSRGVPTWKALRASPNVRLVRLFGPEHGLAGGAVYMEAVQGSIHAPSGLPVVSLYGATAESLKPRREHVADLEAIVFDVADVGSRYYTYIWTMLLAMEACAASRLRFVVCDRPNPIGGEVEGAPASAGYLTFVGLHPIPVRHGMTAGELARLFAAERRLDLDLVVSPAAGWAREMTYADAGLPWTPPSPNMPTTDTALVYPGMCLLEGTNLSEGRGTTRPFEIFGAPWLDDAAFTDALNALALPGVTFFPAQFRPMFDKHAGKACGGARLHVTDRAAFRSFQTGLRIVETARKLAPLDFRWRTEPYEFDERPAIDLLTGSATFRETVDAGESLRGEISRHYEGARQFHARREAHLLYPDRRPAVVAFVGGHDSGKTSVLVELVPRLKARGLVVGTLKHTTRDVEDDVAGKDSQRHAAAGAAVAAFVTPARTTARRFGEEEALVEIIRREFRGCDLVLIEGYKSLAMPKIEVLRTGIARPEVVEPIARISDGPFQGSVPTLSFGDWDAIVATVLRAAGLDRESRETGNGSRKTA